MQGSGGGERGEGNKEPTLGWEQRRHRLGQGHTCPGHCTNQKARDANKERESTTRVCQETKGCYGGGAKTMGEAQPRGGHAGGRHQQSRQQPQAGHLT
jgi:hypothetical protein